MKGREELTSAERVLIAVERWLPTAEARLAVMGDNLDLVDRILIQAARGHWTKTEPEPAPRSRPGIRPEPDHPFEGGYSGMSCVTMVLLADGTGDSCGLPPERHPKPAPVWDPDNPGCAPEECGGSRLDPCSTVMRTKGAQHDGDEPAETYHDTEPEGTTWFMVHESDLVRGGDGEWYEVIRNVPGTGENMGYRIVTLQVGGEERTYTFESMGEVQRRRGPVSRAKQVLADAGLKPEEIPSHGR